MIEKNETLAGDVTMDVVMTMSTIEGWIPLVRQSDALTALAAMTAQVNAPRGTGAQIRKERELCAFSFAGAVADGATGGKGPDCPDAEWLRPAFAAGQEIAQLRAQVEALRKESTRLDMLIEKEMVVYEGRTKHSKCETREDRAVGGIFDSPREAIDAAIPKAST